MSRHLGDRVSALLDGVLSPTEEERAWDHVHQCHPCRDLVEREGWVKTRLATLGHLPPETPRDLTRSLLAQPAHPGLPDLPAGRLRSRPMVVLGGSALGVGAVGAAVVGLMVLGTSPANAPQGDRRAPVTSLVRPSPTSDTPSSSPGVVRRERIREKIGG